MAKYARFTPDEVDFQLPFGAFGRAHIMGFLKQPCVQPGTYRQRVNRSVRKVKDLFTNLELDELSKQEPDFRLTNLSSLTTDLSTVSKEAVELVTLITYMVQKKGAAAWVVFEKITPKCITLSEIHLMWKHGAELLRTHSDVIWCDSLWSVSQDGDNLQTIVIMDKHSKLQLKPCAWLSRRAPFLGSISSLGFNNKFQHSNHSVWSQMELLASTMLLSRQPQLLHATLFVGGIRHKTETKNLAELDFCIGNA